MFKLIHLAVYALASLISTETVGAEVKGKPEQGVEDAQYAIVTFFENSLTFLDADKAYLREVIDRAQAKGAIKQVKIIAWSDKGLPKVGEELSEPDRDMGKARAIAVSHFINTELEKVPVLTYNIAENTNGLVDYLGISETGLKAIFARKTSKRTLPPLSYNELKLIKDKGGPSEAIVLIETQ